MGISIRRLVKNVLAGNSKEIQEYHENSQSMRIGNSHDKFLAGYSKEIQEYPENSHYMRISFRRLFENLKSHILNLDFMIALFEFIIP